MPLQSRKSNSLSAKKQRSLLECIRIQNLSSTRRQIGSSSNEIIDLTIEEDQSDVKAEEEIEILSASETVTINEITCPVCNKDISQVLIDHRMNHVELCLTRLSFNEKKVKTEAEVSKKRKSKDLPPVIKERQKYVNKKVKVIDKSKNQEIKPPKNITGTRKRLPIPEVKLLTFPVESNGSYQIAVDAFNYSPDESITQYFLTHFHSDHYGGITKKWCYERVFKLDDNFEDEGSYRRIIYCSKITAKLLTLKFSIDPRFIKSLGLNKRYLIKRFDDIDVDDGGIETYDNKPGLYVIPIAANHCPGSAIFLFESISTDGVFHRILHCGDFRVNKEILFHPSLMPFNIENIDSNLSLDKVYLDTTYMSPTYNFPKQELVCETISNMFYELMYEDERESLFSTWFGVLKQARITDFLNSRSISKRKKKFLILVGTYLIGKERLAIAISKRLKCPIYVSRINSRRDKVEILKSYENAYLNSVLVDDDLGGNEFDCVIHLVPMNIVSSARELSNYFNHNNYFEYFERCVGLRPTGWTFSSDKGSAALPEEGKEEEECILDSEIEEVSNDYSSLVKLMRSQPKFSFIHDILSQFPVSNSIRYKKGKPDESLYKIYALPYSEHSSYRELSYFSIFLRIDQIIPTVNIGNERSIMKMNEIIRIWENIRNIKLNKNSVDVDLNIVENLKKLTLDDF